MHIYTKPTLPTLLKHVNSKSTHTHTYAHSLTHTLKHTKSHKIYGDTISSNTQEHNRLSHKKKKKNLGTQPKL